MFAIQFPQLFFKFFPKSKFILYFSNIIKFMSASLHFVLTWRVILFLYVGFLLGNSSEFNGVEIFWICSSILLNLLICYFVTFLLPIPINHLIIIPQNQLIKNTLTSSFKKRLVAPINSHYKSLFLNQINFPQFPRTLLKKACNKIQIANTRKEKSSCGEIKCFWEKC